MGRCDIGGGRGLHPPHPLTHDLALLVYAFIKPSVSSTSSDERYGEETAIRHLVHKDKVAIVDISRVLGTVDVDVKGTGTVGVAKRAVIVVRVLLALRQLSHSTQPLTVSA